MSEEVNLLNHLDNLDLTTVDRSFPCLKEGGPITCTIMKFEAKKNAKGTGHNLIVTLRLDQEWPNDEGKPLRPNFQFTDQFSLVQTERYNPAERLADIQLAVNGVQSKGFKFTDYAGRQVAIKVKVDDDPQYGKRNLVRYLKRATPANQPAVATL